MGVYFAKLAEQAERYDEMASYMETVGKMPDELSVEERNLLSVAYKNAVGSRRAAWRIITSVENKEKSKGNEEQSKFAKEYCVKAEGELQKICDTILGVLDTNLIPKASSGESMVFYQKMKADYYRKEQGCRERTPRICRGLSRGREGPSGDTPDPSWPCSELLRLPVRSARQSRRGMQDGAYRFRGRDCRT